MHFILSGLSIVLIDLLLAGDNALVIAMAVRSLPPRERRLGIAGGTAVAVALRIALTLAASRLLNIRYVSLAGGMLVTWIAVKVLVDASGPPDVAATGQRFWQAVRFIVVADVTMSTDNILAIAGAAQGHIELIVFGLCLSIPFVVLSSNLLLRVMDRYPATMYLGAAILANVGAEMMLADPLIRNTFQPGTAVRYLIQALAVAAVLVTGRLLCRQREEECGRSAAGV